ncbi:MAG: D-alanyl-D-alanine carboxypeptidase, partial [Robiginitomaculum sp.]
SETAFADMMTARARALGLPSATFRNSTGWPHDEHKISARDLAVLARYTITQYPEFYDLYGQRSFTWNGIKQANRNPLLSKFTGADGMKTGHTEASKYGLVGSAKRGEKRMIVVVNGLESNALRASESVRLMQAGFDSFKVYSLFKDGETAGEAQVFMGTSETVPLITSGPVQAGFYRPLRKDMKARIAYKGPIAAPIAKGDQIAELVVSVPGRKDERFALLAGEDVARKGFFARAMTALKNKFGG